MELLIPKVKLKTMQLPKCMFSLTICHHHKCLHTLHKRLHHLTSLQRLIQLEDLTLQEVNNAKERN